MEIREANSGTNTHPFDPTGHNGIRASNGDRLYHDRAGRWIDVWFGYEYGWCIDYTTVWEWAERHGISMTTIESL